MKDEYIRQAKVLEIEDGDTLKVEIDLGFDVGHKIALRLFDVFAFETHGLEKPLGIRDKMELEKLIPVNSQIAIQTIKTKKGSNKRSFDRFIAKVWTENGTYINGVLKEKTHGGTGSTKTAPKVVKV